MSDGTTSADLHPPTGYKPPLFQRVDWQVDAACKDLTPQQADKLFYPVGGGVAVTKATLKLCGGCPVKQQCLDYGRDNHEQFGVWGGMAAADIVAATQPVAAVVVEVIERQQRTTSWRRTNLSDDDVRRIRSRHAEGDSFNAIALTFNIDKSIARKIVLKLRFAEVLDEAEAA